MAVMYPADPEYHRPDSQAEKKLYPILAKLPDDWHVFCNRSWHVPPRRGRPPAPAEADFLLAHPARGILVLEVKGGEIRYDPATDIWTSTGRSGTHPLKQSPFGQVERIKYRLRDMLAATGAREIEYPLGEALAFPDTNVRDGTLPPGLLPDRVFDRDDLRDIERSVVRACELFGLHDKEASFGRRGIKTLTGAVAGAIEISRPVGFDIEATERELIRLTEEQYDILDNLSLTPRVCVLGGAGTGKTLLAMEQARRLARQGHRVLITCFNKGLGGYMRRELEGEIKVEAIHFHGLCRTWAAEAGMESDRGKGESEADYYERRLPSLLPEAAAELERSFDAILVDEAQDFMPDWLAALQLLLTSEETGVCFLFADANQAIYQRDFRPPDGFFPIQLTKNLRNTRSIHRLLTDHFAENSTPKGPEGVAVELVTWSAASPLEKALSRLLSKYVNDGVGASSITVLTGRSRHSSRLARFREKEALGKFHLVPVPTRPNEVRIASVHEFKGLEDSVVILCEFEDLYPEKVRELWYTGLSRARAALVVVARDDDGSADTGGIDGLLSRCLDADTAQPCA